MNHLLGYYLHNLIHIHDNMIIIDAHLNSFNRSSNQFRQVMASMVALLISSFYLEVRKLEGNGDG